MIDIAKERAFIQEIDQKSMAMKVEKAKLEQNKAIIEEQLKQVVEKMEKLGCTPETIDQKISEYETKITMLKAKMQSILEPQASQEECPF